MIGVVQFAAMPLRAVIFDFNGVIADDETPHVLAFQQALREHGLELSTEDYYGTHLGMDERNCLTALVTAQTGRPDPELEARIHARKAALFEAHVASAQPPLFPGVVDVVERLHGRYRLAIASGGRRKQIDAALRATPIEHRFDIIVAAEDVRVGKPNPAIYRLALDRLNRRVSLPIQPGECLVLEDSLAGIQAGLAAGMLVIGVASTYSAKRLTDAHRVIGSIQELTRDRLAELEAWDGGTARAAHRGRAAERNGGSA